MDKQKRKQPPQIARSRHWSLKLPVIWLGTSVIVILMLWIQGILLPENLILPFTPVFLKFLILCFPVMILIVGAGQLWCYYRHRNGGQSLLTIIIVLLNTPILFLLLAFLLSWIGTFNHVDLKYHTTINDKNYLVGSLDTTGVMDARSLPYVIYKCDVLWIHCELVEYGETLYWYNYFNFNFDADKDSRVFIPYVIITDDGEQIMIQEGDYSTFTFRPD